MTKKSNVGLILGIIGGVLLIPGIFCTACIGAAADIGSGGSGDGGAIVGYLIGIIGVVLSFVGAGLSKSIGLIGGSLLIGAAVFAFIGLIMSLFTSVFHWAALILLIIGAVYAFKNK